MTLPHPHGTGSGQIGNNANINTSDTPGSVGGRFIGFGEEGTSSIGNRAHWALSENDDYLYTKLSRDMAVAGGASFTSSGQNTFHLTGDVFCGDGTYPGTAGVYDDDYIEGMRLLFSIYDDKFNELTDGAGNEVRVAVVRDTTNSVDVYKTGFVTDPWLTFETVNPVTGAVVTNPYTIPAAQKVRLVLAVKSSLEAMPVDALTRFHIASADEVPAGVVLQDGSRKMTGDFDLDGHDLLNVNDMSMVGDIDMQTHDILDAGNVATKTLVASGSLGSETAISGTGGPTNGAGIIGTAGGGNAIGVQGFGAGTKEGVYGEGASGTAASGVRGKGGTVSGIGVYGEGGASGSGVKGVGGAGGWGVEGYGSSGAHGVYGAGDGVGTGVVGLGGASGAGVAGTGGGSGQKGVIGTGGGGDSVGIEGLGTGVSEGVIGRGGLTDGSIGVYGVSQATNGNGVTGQATGTGIGVTGLGGAVGVYGEGSTGGTGVSGKGEVIGVKGEATVASGFGVHGIGAPTSGWGGKFEGQGTGGGIQAYAGAAASSGAIYAVGGVSSNAAIVADNSNPSGTGVLGAGGMTSGTGVEGAGGVNGGRGGWFHAQAGNYAGAYCAGSGNKAGVEGRGGLSDGPGVLGQGANGSNGAGVAGYGKGSGAGVYGEGDASAAGPGVWGHGTHASYGVKGTNDDGWAVYGYGTVNGGGVLGESASAGAYGVKGISAVGGGVWGESSSATYAAVRGYHTGGGVGVLGSSFAISADTDTTILIPLTAAKQRKVLPSDADVWWLDGSLRWASASPIGGYATLSVIFPMPWGFRPLRFYFKWATSAGADIHKMYANASVMTDTVGGARVNNSLLGGGFTCTKSYPTVEWEWVDCTGGLNFGGGALYDSWLLINFISASDSGSIAFDFIEAIAVTGHLSAPGNYHAGRLAGG